MNKFEQKPRSGPVAAEQLSGQGLLKQHFYLQKFIKFLDSGNPKIPGISNADSLNGLRYENQKIEETLSAFRENQYEEYLEDSIRSVLAETDKKKQVINTLHRQ